MSDAPEVRAVGPAVVIGAEVSAAAEVRIGGSAAGQSASVVSGAPQIVDTSTAPVDEPVALRRGPDGLFRPDRAAVADRPTRVEVTAEIGTSVAAHVLDPEPHPAYDDIPDLTLWFRNALL